MVNFYIIGFLYSYTFPAFKNIQIGSIGFTILPKLLMANKWLRISVLLRAKRDQWEQYNHGRKEWPDTKIQPSLQLIHTSMLSAHWYMPDTVPGTEIR